VLLSGIKNNNCRVKFKLIEPVHLFSNLLPQFSNFLLYFVDSIFELFSFNHLLPFNFLYISRSFCFFSLFTLASADFLFFSLVFSSHSSAFNFHLRLSLNFFSPCVLSFLRSLASSSSSFYFCSFCNIIANDFVLVKTRDQSGGSPIITLEDDGKVKNSVTLDRAFLLAKL